MNGFFAKIVALFAANKITRAISGWGFWFLSSWIFDDFLYPVVIGWLGPIVGGGIMASLAITISWVWLKKIVDSDEEWFSMDVMHKAQEKAFWAVRMAEKISFVKKTWVRKIEFLLTFVAINMAFDPMITTLYFRHGNTEKNLCKKDKEIFVWSALLSNLYWILRSWGVASLVIYCWNLVWH